MIEEKGWQQYKNNQQPIRVSTTVGMVRRILELGEVLASVFTQDESGEIQRAYDLWKSASSSRTIDTGNIIGT